MHLTAVYTKQGGVCYGELLRLGSGSKCRGGPRRQCMKAGRENASKAWFSARTVLCLGKISSHSQLQCLDPFLANRFCKKRAQGDRETFCGCECVSERARVFKGSHSCMCVVFFCFFITVFLA